MRKRVLILGCGGFLGSNLFKHFSAKTEYVVTGVTTDALAVRCSSSPYSHNIVSHSVFKSKVECESGENIKYDVLIDCRWWGVSNSEKNSSDQFSKNLEIVSETLWLQDILQVGKIIFFGSQAEYGKKCEPLTEQSSLEPITEYGKAKVMAYQTITEYFRVVPDKSWNWIRIFSLYGPGDNPTWLPQRLIKALRANETIDTTYGEQNWNYLHVCDACVLIEKIAHSEYSGPINLAHDSSLILAEFLLEALSIVGMGKIVMGGRPYAATEPMDLSVDLHRLHSVTGTTKLMQHSVGIRTLLENWIV